MNQRDAVSREDTMAKEHWIQDATDRMKKKGTVGKFGKATPKKIAAAKKKGGVAKKEAVFAQNMKKAAAKRKHRGMSLKGGGERGRTAKYTGKKRKKGTGKR